MSGDAPVLVSGPLLSGSDRWSPSPRRGLVAGDDAGELGRGPVTVQVYYRTRELDVQKAVERALKRDEQDRIERARRRR